MENEKTQRHITPLWGVLTFLAVMLLMFLVFAPIQHRWGMYGLAVTELGLLAAALLAARLSGQRLKDVFPVKVPRLRQAAGVVLLWLGSWMFVMLVTIVIACLFPSRLSAVSGSLNSVLTSVPPILTLLIGAVMPAVCEEALHRGFILSTFRRVNKKWLVILCMGVIFGLFHADPIRFLPTALLGGVLTYIMLETGNLLLPMLFHFINNAPAAFLTSAPTAAAGSVSAEQALSLFTAHPALMIGAYLTLFSTAPVFVICGAHLLKDKKMSEMEEPAKASYKKKIIAAVGITVFMFLWGIILTSLEMAKNPSLLNDFYRDLQIQL